jgi:hypothetical protein
MHDQNVTSDSNFSSIPKEAGPNDWKLAFSNCKDATSRTIIINLR